MRSRIMNLSTIYVHIALYNKCHLYVKSFVYCMNGKDLVQLILEQFNILSVLKKMKENTFK